MNVFVLKKMAISNIIVLTICININYYSLNTVMAMDTNIKHQNKDQINCKREILSSFGLTEVYYHKTEKIVLNNCLYKKGKKKLRYEDMKGEDAQKFFKMLAKSITVDSDFMEPEEYCRNKEKIANCLKNLNFLFGPEARKKSKSLEPEENEKKNLAMFMFLEITEDALKAIKPKLIFVIKYFNLMTREIKFGEHLTIAKFCQETHLSLSAKKEQRELETQKRRESHETERNEPSIKRIKIVFGSESKRKGEETSDKGKQTKQKKK